MHKHKTDHDTCGITLQETNCNEYEWYWNECSIDKSAGGGKTWYYV